MTWEYLQNKTYRYDFIKDNTNNLGHVIELCNGLGELENYLDCLDYEGCDKLQGVNDDEFVLTIKRCDTLIALGFSGFDVDHHPLESATLTQSVIYLMQIFKPNMLILESVNRYQFILNNIVKDTDYVETIRHESSGPKWTDERTLRIFTL